MSTNCLPACYISSPSTTIEIKHLLLRPHQNIHIQTAKSFKYVPSLLTKGLDTKYSILHHHTLYNTSLIPTHLTPAFNASLSSLMSTRSHHNKKKSSNQHSNQPKNTTTSKVSVKIRWRGNYWNTSPPSKYRENRRKSSGENSSILSPVWGMSVPGVWGVAVVNTNVPHRKVRLGQILTSVSPLHQLVCLRDWCPASCCISSWQ